MGIIALEAAYTEAHPLREDNRRGGNCAVTALGI